ncbi:MAG: hypothetical protein ACLS4Z_09650 [Christensenellaceae bacterium]
MTGSCDDQVLRALRPPHHLRNLESGRREVSSAIGEQGKLTDDQGRPRKSRHSY